MLSLLSLALPLLLSASPAKCASSPLLNCSYVSPTFEQSKSNIEAYALESITSLLKSDLYTYGWIAENAWTAIAKWDQLQKTKTFYNEFSGNQTRYANTPYGGCYEYWHSPLVDCFNDDAQWAALTSLQGYASYGDEIFLQRAESVWEFISNHGFINTTVIKEGYLKGTHYSSNTLEATCNGHSMYGGVYWQNGDTAAGASQGEVQAASNPRIDSGSTGLHALLSAKLFQLTKNEMYLNRTYDVLHFFDNFMIDSDGFSLGPIDGNNCTQPDHFVQITTTGTYMSAYALIGNLTNNATATAIARKSVLNSMTTSKWNNAQGVITAGKGVAGLKSLLIRSLHFVYQYMDSETRAAIEQFINIQYWSMVNSDSNSADKPVLYGEAWQGPYNATTLGQIEALDVLNGLSLNPKTAFPSSDASSGPVISVSSTTGSC